VIEMGHDAGWGVGPAGPWPALTGLLHRYIPTQWFRELRHGQTEAERAAWHLRSGRLGAKLRRPCRTKNWIVDFYCFHAVDP
jgi:Protein of unknown function (DUF559)